MTLETVIPLVVSTLGGAAVGVERQWSGHAEGEKARFAGLRTFTLLGLLGGTWPANSGPAAASGSRRCWSAARRRWWSSPMPRQAGATSTGPPRLPRWSCWLRACSPASGEMQLASGVIALTVLLLVEKSRLHALVRLLDDRGFRAGARFAVLALVVLPLLPDGPYGPLGGIRPRALWALVLFFSGLSFLGYVARTIVGDRYGYTVTGLLGGLVSSTSVTLTYARLSRESGADGTQLASGALAACAVLFVRVALAVAVLNATLLPRLVPLLVAPLAVGAVAAWLSVRRGPSGRATPEAPIQSAAVGGGAADGGRVPSGAVPARGSQSLVRQCGPAGLGIRARAHRRRCPDGVDDTSSGPKAWPPTWGQSPSRWASCRTPSPSLESQ